MPISATENAKDMMEAGMDDQSYLDETRTINIIAGESSPERIPAIRC
jgi:hypothetical protein